MDKERRESAEDILRELHQRYPQLDSCEADIQQAYELLVEAWRHEGKLLVCGNGGSAADSEHIVGELMKSFKFKRKVDATFAEAYLGKNGAESPDWLEGALPAISLVSQVGLMTAFSNDESAVGVFAQQVYGYGRQGDVLLAISTSGNSANVVEAAKVARARDLKVVGLTGASESALTFLADVCIRVPEDSTFKIQELHLPVYHALCAAAEATFFE